MSKPELTQQFVKWEQSFPYVIFLIWLSNSTSMVLVGISLLVNLFLLISPFFTSDERESSVYNDFMIFLTWHA